MFEFITFVFVVLTFVIVSLALWDKARSKVQDIYQTEDDNFDKYKENK